MDAASGQVLFYQNGDEPLVPASLVKIMTLRLAWKALKEGKVKPDDIVTVSQNAWASNPKLAGSSLMFLNVGDKVKFMDIMRGIAIPSGNDATIALAEHLAGSVDVFVQQMNQEAQRLGLKTVRYVDTHGLSPENRISPLDMANLARIYISEFPEALQLHSTKEFAYGGLRPQLNRNGLLWSYPGADGLKTGHTEEAGYNLVVTAKRGDMRLIAVIMGTQDKPPRSGEKIREEQATALLNYGFANFTTVQLVKPGDTVDKVRVFKGRASEVPLVPSGAVVVTLPKGQESKVQRVIEAPKNLTAPVAQGQKVGQLILKAGDQELRRIDLLAGQAVPRGNIFRVLWDSIRLFISNLFKKG